VTLGFNVPQSVPYADEGADATARIRAGSSSTLNAWATAGMLQTFSSKGAGGNGIHGQEGPDSFTVDTQTNLTRPAQSRSTYTQKDGAIIDLGGRLVPRALAGCCSRGLLQEAGRLSFIGGSDPLERHIPQKDKRPMAVRHFFNAYMSAAALARFCKKPGMAMTCKDIQPDSRV